MAELRWICAKACLLLMGMSLAVLSTGCDRRASLEPSVGQVRDSVGIRIVEHGALPEEPPNEWSVGAAVVTIGSASGDGPDLFGRVGWITERSDRTIVVADALDREIRAFHRDGEHLWTAGGPGQGPGEFAVLSSVHAVPGDSIFAVGGRAQGRTDLVVVLGPDGEVVRQFVLDPAPFMVSGVTGGGAVIGFRRTLPMDVEGRYRGTATLVRYNREGHLLQQGPEFPTDDFLRIAVDGGGWLGLTPPGGRTTELVVGQMGAAVTTQDRFEVSRFGPEGELELIVRVEAEPREVDASMRAEFRDVDMMGMSVDVGAHMGELLPAIGTIRLDTEGRLWVEEYVFQDDGTGRHWWVFGVDGDLVARASMPPRFSPMKIAEDYVVGLEMDVFDVPRVQVRSLERIER